MESASYIENNDDSLLKESKPIGEEAEKEHT